ncbi:MAG: hypothetical protein B7Y90_12760 [Alphaproteobacteria bacterium 32-64-14]|nr:MAG: hypothetical protein B7Y90_12760 [Alphaproteobacteria bacterium 32-64-14]
MTTSEHRTLTQTAAHPKSSAAVLALVWGCRTDAVMKKLVALFALSLVIAAPAFAQGAIEPLTIVSGAKTHTLKVEVADTPEEIAKGLMGRGSLAADQGMLFDMRTAPEGTALNMKGVTVNLDLLFVGPEGTVVAVAQNARAGSVRQLNPGLRSAAVIEIAAGQAAALGLKPGDKVRHKVFGNAG